MKFSHLAWLFVAFSLFGGSSLSGQEWARKMFSEHSHDFGIVAAGSEAVHRFEFQNIYKEDVHVVAVRSSCGCTIPSIEKQDVKTFEKSAIVARFNTASFRDQKQATLTVTIDRPFPAEVQLIVRGTIRADVSFEPGSARFGDIPPGKSATSSVRVIHRGDLNWRIVDVKTTFDDSKIRVRLRESNRANGLVMYDLGVELRDNLEKGYVSGELFIETSEGHRYPLPFSGRVVAPLEISPEVLAFAPLEPGQIVHRRVLLKAEKPFRITGINSTDPCLQLRPGNREEALQVVDVTYTAGSETGRHTCEATIATSLGKEMQVTVKAVALVETGNALSSQ